MYSVENFENKYVMKKEFCKMCGISESTGYKLLKSKKVKFEKCNNGLLYYYKIPLYEVEKYILEKRKSVSEDLICNIRYYYEDKLSNYPDVITSKDIIEITGYGKETIRNWIINEKILGIVVRKQFKVAKEDLFDLLISPYYFNIIRKSQVHVNDFKNIGIF